MQFEQVYGIFPNIEDAEKAISALKDHGVGGNEISVVRRSDGRGMPGVEDGGSHGITTTTAEDAAAGALKGGAAGIALGVLAGAVALAVPGFGLVMAAGPLWAAFGATLAAGAAGAVSGGVIGYLVDQGVPHDLAHTYGAAINRGDVLVAVRSDHVSSGDAAMLLEKYGATEIGRHAVGETTTTLAEPPIRDMTATELEHAAEDDAAIAVSPVTPSMPLMPGPIGR